MVYPSLAGGPTMSEAQLKALRWLRDHGPSVASDVGVAICGENYPESDHPRSRQGLGRTGGATLRRLFKAGLVAWNWPTYRLTAAGRDKLLAQENPS